MTLKIRTDDEIRVAMVCPKCGQPRTKTSALYLRCLPCDSRLFCRLNEREWSVAKTHGLCPHRSRAEWAKEQRRMAIARHQSVLEFLGQPRTASEVCRFRDEGGVHPLLARMVGWGLVRRIEGGRVLSWQAVVNGEPENAEGD